VNAAVVEVRIPVADNRKTRLLPAADEEKQGSVMIIRQIKCYFFIVFFPRSFSCRRCLYPA
jgi:hypothetical protein